MYVVHSEIDRFVFLHKFWKYMHVAPLSFILSMTLHVTLFCKSNTLSSELDFHLELIIEQVEDNLDETIFLGQEHPLVYEDWISIS